jgi:phytanoyl-CoA hydroxylase
MKSNLTQNQIDVYQEDGFLIVEDFLGPQELEQMREDVAQGVEKIGNNIVGGVELPADESGSADENSYYQQVFVQKMNLWKLNDNIKKFFQGPVLGKMLCELAGVDGLRVWHDQTLQKKPWANPTGWHLDNPYWSFHSRNAISIWIALDDATFQNGCLYYLPGSHKIAKFDNVTIDENVGGLFEVYPEFKDCDVIPGEMKAGSCGFHNGITAHGAGANMTPNWRRAMTCAYMPEGSIFNGQQNFLTKEQFEKLTLGQVMEDNDLNPLVWSKNMAFAK